MKKNLLLIFLFNISINIYAQNWTSLGSGLNNSVYAIVEYNGEIYAGGAFDSAGGIPASHIAKWNGSNWTVVGDGLN